MHYLFVSEDPVACSPVPSGKPAYSAWSESMFRLLLDSEGIAIAAGKAKGFGWSKINEDLVHIFKKDAVLKANNLAALASWFNNFKDLSYWFAKAGKESLGIDTLFIIVRDQKLFPDDSLGSKTAWHRSDD
jgi:hypothetical protein